MPQFYKWAAMSALLATASMAASPIAAAQLPHMDAALPQVEVPVSFDPADQIYAHYHHRYRHHRYRRHHGIDAGDVLAGVLIVGGIVAIASAVNRDDDRRRVEDRREDNRRNEVRGIDRAVDMCITKVERDRRVTAVDRANRTVHGWQISGTLANGEGFTCEIDKNGRIEAVNYNSYDGDYYRENYTQAPADDRQWDDKRYIAERGRVDQTSLTPIHNR